MKKSNAVETSIYIGPTLGYLEPKGNVRKQMGDGEIAGSISTTHLRFKRPQISSKRDHQALIGGCW